MMANKNDYKTLQRYQPPSRDTQLSLDTIAKIKTLKLDPNPIHYTLIYEWLGQIDPYLTEEINKAITLKTYDDTTAQSLFIEYITLILQHKIPTEEVGLLLNDLLFNIDIWSKMTQEKQDNIRNEIKKIDLKSPPLEIIQLVKKMLVTLDDIAKDTQELQQQVRESTLEIKKLKEELEAATVIAKTDELTNIPNRRGFNEIIETLVRQAMQEQASFALIMIDIDLFKQINDTFGHLIGDSVLRYIARLLSEETKGRDSIARIGGEEFVILLPHTTYSEAIKVANNIREKVASKTLNVKSSKHPLKLTISAGVAMYQMNEQIDKLIHRADAALYKAKNSGRNRTVGEDALN